MDKYRIIIVLHHLFSAFTRITYFPIWFGLKYIIKLHFKSTLTENPWIFPWSNRVQKRWHHKKLSAFGIPCISEAWWKSSYSPNMVGISSWGSEMAAWIPNQCKLAWFPTVMNQANLHSFGVWRFFIMFYWNMVMKMLKCKNRKFYDVTLQYSII